MVARDPQGREPLITFRLERRIDDLPAGESLRARRIADHRPRYLAYEGPLSNDRGCVRCLARGSVIYDHRQPDLWQLEVLWSGPPGGQGRQHLRLRRRGGSEWVIETLDRASAGGPHPPPPLPEGEGGP